MRHLASSLALLAALGLAGGLAAGERQVSPALVELFTSQGCSSCPPADRLLSTLGASPELDGRIVALAFHVDYWNYIGWTDPFSSPRWSERQREYGRLFGDGRIYTPQLVIDGRTELVGSDRRRVTEALERALAAPRPASVALSEAGGAEPGTLAVRVEARLGEDAPAGPHRVLVALTESGLETPVARGENGGRTLRNDHVVRSLLAAGTLAGPGAELSARVVLPLAAGSRRDRIEVVAFVQDPATGAVLGTALPLAPGG